MKINNKYLIIFLVFLLIVLGCLILVYSFGYKQVAREYCAKREEFETFEDCTKNYDFTWIIGRYLYLKEAPH